jgi:hypothetical protein
MDRARSLTGHGRGRAVADVERPHLDVHVQPVRIASRIGASIRSSESASRICVAWRPGWGSLSARARTAVVPRGSWLARSVDQPVSAAGGRIRSLGADPSAAGSAARRPSLIRRHAVIQRCCSSSLPPQPAMTALTIS